MLGVCMSWLIIWIMQGWSLGCLHIGNTQVLICLQNYSKKGCSWGSRGSLEAPTGLALWDGCTCSFRPGPQWQCGGCGATREDGEEPSCPVTLVWCSRHFGEAVSPACQLLFTIDLLDHYEIRKNLSNLGIQALICTLRGSKDTEWLPWAKSGEKKPQWICPTLNVQPERSFAMGLSPHPALRCPGGSCLIAPASDFSRSLVSELQGRCLSGNTLNLKTGCDADFFFLMQRKKKSLLKC